jgi:hypothetical protein
MEPAASVGPPISRSPLKSRRSSSRIVSGSPLVRRQPAGASCMELDTTTFGFASQIRANSSVTPVAAGSVSAVGH